MDQLPPGNYGRARKNLLVEKNTDITASVAISLRKPREACRSDELWQTPDGDIGESSSPGREDVPRRCGHWEVQQLGPFMWNGPGLLAIDCGNHSCTLVHNILRGERRLRCSETVHECNGHEYGKSQFFHFFS